MLPRDRVAFALDYPTLAEASAGAALAAPAVGVLKVGLELFVREGPRAVEIGAAHDRAVFLDLKLHDIPETVERAVHNAAALGARYLTLHASGGRAMLERAANAAARAPSPLTLLAVTVLTSLDQSDLASLGTNDSPREHVVRLARLAFDSGVTGFVTSAQEVAALREAVGPTAFLVTPGIRPVGAGAGDQKRVATPTSALQQGADLLVIGRPIRDASDPRAAAFAIVDEVAAAVSSAS
ncbi:MAG: orotidine-5'-phosphate decarboxylase [Polyangiaceae bacterium]|nr:orotidine-5'-phosphate decarboxylase [Polyangiaceae bacterium]